MSRKRKNEKPEEKVKSKKQNNQKAATEVNKAATRAVYLRIVKNTKTFST